MRQILPDEGSRKWRKTALDFQRADFETLREHAAMVQQPTDLVIAPVELHKRHLKQRLSQSKEPLTAFDFTDGATVAKRLLDTADRSTQSLDRVDRLHLLDEILADEGPPREFFEVLLGQDPTSDLKMVERTRSEIEAITNYHPERVESYKNAAETLAPPIEADAHDVLDGVLRVERELRRRTEIAPTDTELIRLATREIVESNGSIWESAYPDIERVVVVGLSNVSASLIDLLTAIARNTTVEAAIWLRSGTESALSSRLPLTVVTDPGEVSAQ